VLSFERLWLSLWSVAFKAKRVGSSGPQQMLVIPAVRLVTGCATLRKRGLMQVCLLELICLLAVTAEASINRIGLWETWRLAGMRVVTVRAVSRRTWMLDWRLLDLLRLLLVAGNTDRLWAGLSKNHLSVLGWLMAAIARFRLERTVLEGLHQFRRLRLVGIVASQAVGFFKGLVLMRLRQLRILGVVTIDAERRSILGQVFGKLAVGRITDFVGDVAGFAPHVEGSMAAALGRRVETHVVALQTKVVGFRAARRGLQ